MKLLRISAIRILAAVVVGVLLLMYGDAVLKGLTIVMGIMFLVAGVVSLVGWVMQRGRKPSVQMLDDGTSPSAAPAAPDAQPAMFPIVGLGSVLLGCLLSFTQTADFLSWAMYLVGGLLVLAAVNLLMNVHAARKMEPVSAWLWLPPCAIIVASGFAMLKGLVPAQTCTTILGVAALVFAALELIYSLLFYNIRKRYMKTQAQVQRANAAPAQGTGAAAQLPTHP